MRGRAWARACFKLQPVSIPATMCRRLRRARHTDTLDRRLQTTCHAAKRVAVRASQAWHSRGGSFPPQQRSLSPRKSTRGRPLHVSLSQRAHGLESAPPTGCARPVVTASGWRRRVRTRAARSRGASCSRALAAASAVWLSVRSARLPPGARALLVYGLGVVRRDPEEIPITELLIYVLTRRRGANAAHTQIYRPKN
jgi:hypothetical protein